LVKELQDLSNPDAIKRAYQAGADMELGAGMEWFRRFYKGESWMLRDLNSFKTARRPKPPSLKDQPLNDLDNIQTHDQEGRQIIDLSNIRLALESLPQ
jgi:hypothetical protein